jgi:hypothetical protein
VGRCRNVWRATYIDAGLLVVKTTVHAPRVVKVNYAWRQGDKQSRGRAMQWWLDALENSATRAALLERHRGG